MKKSREAFVGIDAAKARNAVTLAESGRQGEMRYLGELDANADGVAKLVRKLSDRYETVHFCYEAGPTGYGLYLQILSMGPRVHRGGPVNDPAKARRAAWTYRHPAGIGRHDLSPFLPPIRDRVRGLRDANRGPVFSVRLRAVSPSWPRLSAASRAGCVNAGRKPPPEAAQSGVYAAEHDGSRGATGQRRVRPNFVEIALPIGQHQAGVPEGGEQRFVQALIAPAYR